VANTWTATGSLTTARDSHTATLLPSGKVLVAGGYGLAGPLTSAELYDPASGTWSSAASMGTVSRYSHTAVLLPSGEIIVAGGSKNGVAPSDLLASTMSYEITSGLWSAVGAMTAGRYLHTATLLDDGRVLAVGGQNLASADLYNPATNSWSAASPLTATRWCHTATLLPNHLVMVAGGCTAGTLTSSAALFDPFANTWTPTGSLLTARYSHTATLLANYQVLIVGGSNVTNHALSSAELFTPNLLTPLEVWRFENFNTTANLDNAADTADPDHDGIPNLLEFAFGLNPHQNLTGQVPQWQPDGTNQVLSFIQPASVSGITYAAEWSATMLPGSWQPVPDTGTAPQHLFTVSTVGKPQLFLRIKITAP
jgi:N-acetylneuraminic acid mutarotase